MTPFQNNPAYDTDGEFSKLTRDGDVFTYSGHDPRTMCKAQFAAGLADIISETTRLWRKHHLGYDQTKYVVEQARRRLKLQPVGNRRRTVKRLDKSEVERLVASTYQSHNKYGLMIETLFLSDILIFERHLPQTVDLCIGIPKRAL